VARTVRLRLDGGGPTSELPSPAPRVRCLISLKAAGDLSLRQEARRRLFFQSLGLSPQRVLALRQVHSRRVLAREELGPAGPPEADGLLALDSSAVLTVTVADCLPIFVADRRTGARGLLHSGWKGTGIVSEAVARMAALYGTRPADLAVVIGPGIGPCCYDVPRERFELFLRELGPRAALERGGRTYLDLRSANLVLLERLGVADVTVVEDCTACTPELASFRVLGSDGYVGMMAVMGEF
jgi:YfiH family protein